MAFGRRPLASLRSDRERRPRWGTPPTTSASILLAIRSLAPRESTSKTSRRQVAATALLGIVLGFGCVTAGTTFVQASERSGIFSFFDDLFRPPTPQPVVRARQAPRRYSSLPDARRVSATRSRHVTPRPMVDLSERRRARSFGRFPARAESAPTLTRGPQTVCVRTCDGYLFPLGRLASRHDLPVHQAACAAACPNAQTALFTLPAGRTDLDQAVSLKGSPYLAAAWANVYRKTRVQDCSCQPPGVAASPLPIDRDSTVRVGDLVATEDSADLVTALSSGTVELSDFRSARGLTRRARREIDRRVGAMQRDANEASYRRSLRKVVKTAMRVRFAEAGFERLRKMEAGAGFTEVTPVSGGATATPIRVVTPWVDEHARR